MSKLHLSLLCLATAGLMLTGCSEQAPTKADPTFGAAKELALPEADLTLGPDGQAPIALGDAEVILTPAAKIASGSLGNVLVFGDYSSKNELAAALSGFGYAVTNVSSLPADLSPFATIWHVSAFTTLSAAEQTRLAGFLAAGKGLHLTGERPCCESLNSSLTTFVNSVVVGGGVTVGGQGDINSATNAYGYPYPVNPGAEGNIASTPGAISNLYLAASGGIAGVSGANVLATGFNNVPVGAIWDSNNLVGNAGRLTLVMDVNWFSSSYRGPENLNVYRNIQVFLESGGIAANQPPTADAGDDQSVECAGAATTLTLNGSGSADADGDPLTYTWSGPFGTASGVSPVVALGHGSHSITLTVDDGKGGTATDEVVVNIVDTTAPALALTLSSTSLWPPNHVMVQVGSIAAADLCDASAALDITVTSNEPENGTGDGDTGPDWEVVDNGDGTATVSVRAERKGNGTGRVYTISVTATDEAGNSSSQTGTVTVAHSQSKKK